MERYFEALLKDMKKNGRCNPETVYTGGGTPSVPPNVLTEKLFSCITSLTGENTKEFTVEANPDSVNEDFLKICKKYGVTRLSLGVQSMDDNVLRILGRAHSASDVVKAVSLVRKYGFDMNLDFIYDIPTVSKKTEMQSLKEICGFEPEHISAYAYSYDTGYLSDETDEKVTMFTETADFLKSRGFEKYEISNFAKEGHRSLHNIRYWDMKDYIGIGAGAHSLLNTSEGRITMQKPDDIYEYIKDPESYICEERTKKDNLLAESIIFGLRKSEGVNYNMLQAEYGRADKPLQSEIDKLIDGGFLICSGDFLKTTEKGELLLDSVQQRLWL